MTKRFFACATLSVALLLAGQARVAHADAMDLALERLVTGGSAACEETLPPGNPTSGPYLIDVDNDAWASLMAELSAATMPSLLQPVTTTGPSGVDIMFAQTFTGIHSKADYWRRGSRGSGSGSQRDCSGRNTSVKHFLSRSELRMLKSLPFGFTFGSTLGKVLNTSLWTFGGELKIALVEGYRTLAVPDIAVRAAANTVVGDSTYGLTNLAVSVIVSKPFVAQVVRLTPYLAYQIGVGFGHSALINLTPHTDAFVQCDQPPPVTTGSYECASGNPYDLGYDRTFKDLTLLRHQLAAGLVLRYKLGTLTAEFLMDAVPISQSEKQVPKGVKRQWSVSVSPGISF